MTVRRRIAKGVTHAELRKQAAQNDRRVGGRIGPCIAEEIQGAPVPVTRISAPDSRKDRAILYFHGGGFCVHLPNTYQRHAARLSKHTGAAVYVVDYRLAPEHSIATSFRDAFESYKWLLGQGLPASSIIVAGDSAGGGLTLGTCQRARDHGVPLPAGMLMLSPGLKATFDTPSMTENDGKDPMFSYQGIVHLRDITLRPGESPADVELSPGLGMFDRLPPMRFDVGTTELLRDDSREAVAKARAQGAKASLHEWPSMAHVFQVVPWLPETKRWLAEVGDFSRRCWDDAANRES